MIPNPVAPSISAVPVVPPIESAPRLAFSYAASSDSRRRPFRRSRGRPAEWVDHHAASSRIDDGTTPPPPVDGGTVVVVDYDDRDMGVFNARLFASSDCWGRRPLLVRGGFDPYPLLGHNSRLGGEDSDLDGESSTSSSFAPWPSWEEVVDIASDVDSESR